MLGDDIFFSFCFLFFSLIFLERVCFLLWNKCGYSSSKRHVRQGFPLPPPPCCSSSVGDAQVSNRVGVNYFFFFVVFSCPTAIIIKIKRGCIR